MKIHITDFRSTQDRPFDYYIQDIKAGITKEGIVIVRFNTRDKYYNVDARFSYTGPDPLRGECIEIWPFIYDETGKELDVFDHPDHPENFFINMLVPCEGYYTRIVTPLKHQYFVCFIPFDLLHDYDTPTEAEVVFVNKPNYVGSELT